MARNHSDLRCRCQSIPTTTRTPCPRHRAAPARTAMIPTELPRIVLASSSPYRQALLRRVLPEFSTAAPDIDESPLPAEAPETLVRRLAEAKARAVALTHPDALIIGSDQVAALGAQLLTKPGHRSRAIEQLRACSGHSVRFCTGLCVLDAPSATADVLVEAFTVHFLSLSPAQIEHYIDREQPLDCAGAFKAEGLGVALFERLEGDDPSSLIGLPLIALCGLLRKRGIDPLLL